uniref:MORN repeat-containing protein 5 n=1 Tax=Arcella intermedia TaxID=1963864 RepID=A0A6B2LHM7_9EUKA
MSVGTYCYADGVLYHGGFQNRRKHGRGTSVNEEGVYEGEFCNGERHGFGTMWFDNGDKYRGNWYEGLFQGKGVYYVRSSNSYYYAHWNDGKKVHGTWVRDKNIYSGPFEDGLFNGKGIYTYPNGTAIEATFQRGRVVSGSEREVDSQLEWTVGNDFYSSRPEDKGNIVPQRFKNVAPLRPPAFPDGWELDSS